MVETRSQSKERGQMRRFVRYLTKIMPLSSLTQKIVRELYQAFYKKQMTGPHSETLRHVVVEVAKAQKNKDFKDSRLKTHRREIVFGVLRSRREIERDSKEIARLRKENDRKIQEIAKKKMLRDQLDRLKEQLELYYDLLRRIPKAALDDSEQIESLTLLSMTRVGDVIDGLMEKYDIVLAELGSYR